METIYGPVNYFKISGEINGNKKVIHCFCDKHIPFSETNDMTTTLETFLNNLFQTSKLDWDFMVEADTLNKPQEKNQELYLTRMRNYAYALKQSKMYSNLRVHHTDIRWIFSQYLGIDYILEQVKSGVVETKIKTNGIAPVQKYFKTTSDRIRVIIKILKGEEFIPTCDYEEIVFRVVSKIIKKINLCENKEISEYLHEILTYNLLRLEELSNDILNVKSFGDVLIFVTNLHIYTAFLMDMYLLRRILDKNYVTNVILYCGSYHAYSLLISLKNNFEFDLEHISKNPFDKVVVHNDILELIMSTPNIKEQSVTVNNELF
jgi:hypothetical protein